MIRLEQDKVEGLKAGADVVVVHGVDELRCEIGARLPADREEAVQRDGDGGRQIGLDRPDRRRPLRRGTHVQRRTCGHPVSLHRRRPPH